MIAQRYLSTQPYLTALSPNRVQATARSRITDRAAVEGAYQDVSTLGRLEEGRKPYVSLEGMRILQRLLKPGNPKVGELKVENLIDSSIMKRIDDSGFFEKMTAEYAK